MTEHQLAVVVGDLDLSRLVCAELRHAGTEVRHLLQPTEAELTAALTPEVSAVAVLVRGDVVALRYALLTEHVRPHVRLIVTLFDRTVGDQLLRVVPNCLVTSPADVAVPSIIAGCLSDDLLVVDGSQRPPFVLRGGAGGAVEDGWQAPRPRRLWRGRLRSHEESSSMMLVGLAGLAGILTTDWALSVLVLHERGIVALFTGARVLATVGGLDPTLQAPDWYLVVSTLLTLMTIALTAIFTAGVVNRLLTPRYTSIVGRRTVPRRGHVVVIGLGQVGIRLSLQLRALGIPVVAVERDRTAANLELAKSAKIPTLLGSAAERRVLERLGLDRAVALAAMGSDDLDNVEVAIAALAVAPDLRVVLRAGEGDVINESQSLFSIGQVRDVSALTALAVTRGLVGSPPASVFQQGHRVAAFDGLVQSSPFRAERCTC